jgi:hypothetical protein
MSGKASLLVIAGFSLIFLVVGQNFGSLSNRAVDNYVTYQKETVAHNIAISGANIAANELFLDRDWTPAGYPKQFQGGELNVSIELVDETFGYREITATGTYFGKTSEIKIRVAPSNFSEYAYYSTFETNKPGGVNIWWTGKDTVWGPFHTQDKLRVYQHPSFLGKHTSHKGSIVYYTSKSKDAPVITGLYEPGKSVVLPTNAVEDLESKADEDGLKFSGHDTVYIVFNHDSLKYKYKYSETYQSVYLPDSAANGLIYAKDCVVRLKGVVKGQYTLGCSSAGTSLGKGTVWLDDDIVYETNPLTDPESQDLFGIVAENYVYISRAAPNDNDINIHASIFSEKWGFGAYQYDTRPLSGNINLLGGIQQNYRQPVGTFGSKSTGFYKQYRYDWRLGFMSPPFYPGTGGFRIVSWYE